MWAMMICTWRGVNRLPCGPSSSSKGAIHRAAVWRSTPHRAANCDSVMAFSFIFHDFVVVWLLQCGIVDAAHRGLECREIEHAVLSAAHVVGGGEHGEVRCVGEEQRRHGGEAVSDGSEIDVVLSARQEHGAYLRILAVGHIDAAVVEHEEAMAKHLAHLVNILGFAAQVASCALVGGYALRVRRVYVGNVGPLVVVRRDNEYAAVLL